MTYIMPSSFTNSNNITLSNVLDLTKKLVSRASISPNDCGCQDILAERLEPYDFEIERLPFVDTQNMFAIRRSKNPPKDRQNRVFLFAGHTDVVPSGDESKWRFEPFAGTINNNKLYGRGTADMKGALAAMIVATEQFVVKHPNHHHDIAFLITSDEEAKFVNGTTKVVDVLSDREQFVDWCVIGEPSSEEVLGDTIKIGRRGSLNGKVRILGIQGHVAYPHLAENPIHQVGKFISRLVEHKWQDNHPDFPDTSLQITNINGGLGADNMIPGDVELRFNVRYSPNVTAKQIRSFVHRILQEERLNYQIEFSASGPPFYTSPCNFIQSAKTVVESVCKKPAKLSTGGGTSDGRFICRLGCDIVEIGLVNQTIHKINEHTNIVDLFRLTQIYLRLLEEMLVNRYRVDE